MSRTTRWVVAGLVVLGALVTVIAFDPTTCHVDVCSSNALLDIGIPLAGLVVAIVLLTIRR